MKSLSSLEVFTFVDNCREHRIDPIESIQKIQKVTLEKVRKQRGHFVWNYQILAQKIAELQYHNPEFVLFFRGQQEDHLTSTGNTSILPSIYRNDCQPGAPREKKFTDLDRSATRWMKKYYQSKAQKDANRTKISRMKILQWAILQHYQQCKTPVLDVTQSLRVACSFAANDDKNPPNEAFLMVLALPQIHGPISVCTASEIQIIRLASIVHPKFARPHVQEGFALAEYPDPVAHDTRGSYEFDFGRRLIAKFRFNPKQFWVAEKDSFPPVAHSALYPKEKPFA